MTRGKVAPRPVTGTLLLLPRRPLTLEYSPGDCLLLSSTANRSLSIARRLNYLQIWLLLIGILPPGGS